MDLKNIEYLFTLEELGSVSAAAKKLYIAQPTLSQFLKKYENDLGYPIFCRTKSGLKLTQEGQFYLDTARQMLNLEQNMRNRLADQGETLSGTVVFALSSQRAPYVLPHILPEFSRRYPNVTVKIIEGKTKDLEFRIQNGDIHCGILIPPLHTTAIDYEVFMKEEILLGVPKAFNLDALANHTPGKLPWLNMKELASYPFLLHDTSNRLRDFSNELFHSCDFEPAHALEFKSTELIARLASAGMGIAFLAETFIEPEYDLNYYSIGEKGCFRSLALGYPVGYRSHAVIKFSEMLKHALYKKQEQFRKTHQLL